MDICDLCSTPLGSDVHRFSASQMKAAVRSGLRPPEGAFAFGTAFGMSHSQTEEAWIQKVMADTTDWLLCSGCAARTAVFDESTELSVLGSLVRLSNDEMLARFDKALFAAAHYAGTLIIVETPRKLMGLRMYMAGEAEGKPFHIEDLDTNELGMIPVTDETQQRFEWEIRMGSMQARELALSALNATMTRPLFPEKATYLCNSFGHVYVDDVVPVAFGPRSDRSERVIYDHGRGYISDDDRTVIPSFNYTFKKIFGTKEEIMQRGPLNHDISPDRRICEPRVTAALPAGEICHLEDFAQIKHFCESKGISLANVVWRE